MSVYLRGPPWPTTDSPKGCPGHLEEVQDDHPPSSCLLADTSVPQNPINTPSPTSGPTCISLFQKGL